MSMRGCWGCGAALVVAVVVDIVDADVGRGGGQEPENAGKPTSSFKYTGRRYLIWPGHDHQSVGIIHRRTCE